MESIVVLVSCASHREAEKITRAVLRKRLAACANILKSSAKSIYRWKGKIEVAAETLMLVKTTRRKFGALEREIGRLHSYDTPEIIALPIIAGSKAYLKWVTDCVATTRRPRHGRGQR